MTPWLFLISSLATYRLTRLWVYDSITAEARLWVAAKLVPMPTVDSDGFALDVPAVAGFRVWLLDLLSCRWCLSVWVSGGLTLAWSLYEGAWSTWTDVLPFLTTWMALAAAAAFWFLAEDALTGE